MRNSCPDCLLEPQARISLAVRGEFSADLALSVAQLRSLSYVYTRDGDVIAAKIVDSIADRLARAPCAGCGRPRT